MLSQIKHLILDMDGVLWRGDTPIPRLSDFFAGLDAMGIEFTFATNNASKTPTQYLAKFERFGVAIQKWQVMTSALATAAYLAQVIDRSRPIYVVGSQGLLSAIEEQGFEVLPRFERHVPAAAVAVGFNQQVTYDDFSAATNQIRAHNARFVGCNPDSTFPSEQGLMPGNGALIALLEAATDQKAEIIGKPYPRMFEACLANFGPLANGTNTAVVGDRLNTDILGGHNAGLKTIMVLTGISNKAHVAQSDFQPDRVFDDIHTLLAALQHSRTTPTP